MISSLTYTGASALNASNASVRASNRNAVAHHSTKAYDTGPNIIYDKGVFPVLRPSGHFNKAGAARTPSGHEF